MDSETKTKTEQKKPKPFSIESIIGCQSNRKSPVKETAPSTINDLNKMRYFLPPFLAHGGGNLGLFLRYPEPWMPRAGDSSQGPEDQVERRDSPLSVGSDIDSDVGDDNNQGLFLFKSLKQSSILPIVGTYIHT